MNKSLQMRYYHELRKTNPALSKSKAGRSMIMNIAVDLAIHLFVLPFGYCMYFDKSEIYIYKMP